MGTFLFPQYLLHGSCTCNVLTLVLYRVGRGCKQSGWGGYDDGDVDWFYGADPMPHSARYQQSSM